MLPLREIHYQAIGERWKLVPSYAEYMLLNFRTSKPAAVIFDLDGCIRPDHPVLQHRVTFPNVLEAMDKLHSLNITMYIVTARPTTSKEATMQYMSACGMSCYIKEVFFLPMTGINAIDFKSHTRTQLRETHSIIMAIGDQKQDLCYNDEDEEDDCCLNILMENPFTFQ